MGFIAPPPETTTHVSERLSVSFLTIRGLGRPDKTACVSLKQLLAAGLIRKERDRTYLITEQGKAALVEEELEETAVDLVEKLGPERARTVRRCLAELLVEHASEHSPGETIREG